MTDSIIIIDPGHGGLDFDGRYTTQGKQSEFIIQDEYKYCYEGVLNRAVAHLLQFRLSHQGIKSCILADHTDVPLRVRSTAANDIAKGKKAVLISIHHNAFRDTSVKGFEVFAYSGLAPTSQDIAQDAGDIFLSHFKGIRKQRITGDLHRGELATYKKADFHILRETKMPSILMEFGFMTNREEFGYITSLEGIQDQVRYLEHVCEFIYQNYL